MPIKDWPIAEKANLTTGGQVKRSGRNYNTLREQLVSVKTNLSRSARLCRSHNTPPCGLLQWRLTCSQVKDHKVRPKLKSLYRWPARN